MFGLKNIKNRNKNMEELEKITNLEKDLKFKNEYCDFLKTHNKEEIKCEKRCYSCQNYQGNAYSVFIYNKCNCHKITVSRDAVCDFWQISDEVLRETILDYKKQEFNRRIGYRFPKEGEDLDMGSKKWAETSIKDLPFYKLVGDDMYCTIEDMNLTLSEEDCLNLFDYLEDKFFIDDWELILKMFIEEWLES